MPLIVNTDDSYLFLAPPDNQPASPPKTGFMPDPIGATPAPPGVTISPSPIKMTPSPKYQPNVQKKNKAKPKKKTRSTSTNVTTNTVFRSGEEPIVLTDTIGIGSAEGRRQSAKLNAASNLDNLPKTKRNNNSFFNL